MTIIPRLDVTVKFFRHDKGYGFFQAPGLPDIHIIADDLVSYGFTSKDMQSGRPALVDARLKGQHKLSLVTIHSIDDKPASKPESAAVAETVSEPSAPAATTNSDIEPAEEQPKTLDGRKVGDIVPARFKAGFDEKKPGFGFFIPTNGGRDIFVPLVKVPLAMQAVIAEEGGVYDLLISDINNRGLVGQVQSRHFSSVCSKAKHEFSERMQTKEQKHAVRQRTRAERQKALLKRDRLTVTDGQRTLSGVPVTGSEWPSLPAGTRAVLVDTYHVETRTVEGVQEHFVVQKPGGKPRQFQAVEVWHKVEAKGKVKFIEPIGTGLFQTDDATLSAPIFSINSREDVAKVAYLVRRGTYAAVALQDAKGNFMLGRSQKGQDKLHQVDAELIRVLEWSDNQVAAAE